MIRGFKYTLYFRFLAFTLMALTYLPIIYQNLPSFVRSHYLWSAIWIISTIILIPSIFLDKTLKYVIFYFIVLFLLTTFNFWVALGSNPYRMDSPMLTEMIAFIMAFSISAYFNTTKDTLSLAILLKWTIGFISVTAILSIISSFIDPLYARKLSGGEYEGLNEFAKFGGGGYGYASALVCLFPIMIYYYRNNLQCLYSKKQILFFGILCLSALIRMQIVANILVAVVFIILSLAGSRSFKRSVILLVLLSILIIVIPQKYYISFFAKTSTFFNKESEVSYKLNDMSKYIAVGGSEITEAGGRADRYPLLWKALKKNPLFGYFYTESIYTIDQGGHLYFMYKLAGWGILNFLFFLYIFFKFIKINLKRVDDKYSFYLLLSFISIIVLGLMKSLVSRELWYAYFVILPGLYYLKKPKIRIVNRVKSLSNIDYNTSIKSVGN